MTSPHDRAYQVVFLTQRRKGLRVGARPLRAFAPSRELLGKVLRLDPRPCPSGGSFDAKAQRRTALRVVRDPFAPSRFRVSFLASYCA
ncbi:hypothetical protein A9Q02_18665 [Candidatus Chloroploca asiatica]|uniref:Uncharacterized protein n=1 Tax=Candidatus Chloroploca asiatica TaxID=1506545 RepID=A0A2H3KJN8_9CHLR|nr:hypothetical protein A9Q02_18665 [Candidatus Chloroploca asiatica]